MQQFVTKYIYNEANGEEDKHELNKETELVLGTQ